MIIDISSKAKQKSQEQETQQQQAIVDRLKIMLRLAEEGLIVSFASCGFISEGRMFINFEQGLANPHDTFSAINTMRDMFSQVVINNETNLAQRAGPNVKAFHLPKLSEETS